jgi:hypothetical protein
VPDHHRGPGQRFSAPHGRISGYRRDLQLIEAIAEQTEGLRIVDLLAQWRLYNYMVLRERRSVPVSFETHVSERPVNGMPYLSSHEHVVGARLFEELRWHAARLLIANS